MAKGTVLIVDDEPSVRELAADILRPEGYVVLEASSGPEALDVCAEHAYKIDVLLTDLIMPGMTGRVLADILTARCPGLGVAFMSGFIDKARAATRDEDIPFIQKPFERAHLNAMIRDVIRKKKSA